MSFVALFIAAQIAAPATAPAGNGTPPAEACRQCGLGFLVYGDSLPTPVTEHINLSGRGGAGVPFRVLVDSPAESGIIVIQAFVRGRRWGSVRLDRSRFPSLDLPSADIQFDNRNILSVQFRYGETRVCFYNYDGRDQVAATFYSSAPPRAENISFAECGTVTEDIPLDR